jgi:hypothetical protein
MLPLFDMLANAQNGHGIEALARQFNLSQLQTQQALEALLPAFSQGLKRNASDPYGIAAFMNAMATGQHAKYFEELSRAATPEGVAEGNGILGHLFGSKELSRAVAAQAAQATGISQEIFRQMLPVIASMMMGGFFKQATGQMGGGGFGGGAQNPFAEVIEQMMRQGGAMGMPERRREPAPQSPFDNPFGRALEGMFGSGAPQRSSQDSARNPYENPLGRIFEDFLRAGQRRPEFEPDPEPAPRANPSGRPRNPYDDLFGQMFETGRQQRDEYQRQMENIFDQFRKGMQRHH